MKLLDQKFEKKYIIIHSLIAITFGSSIFFSFYIGFSGWFFTGWDFLELSAPPNLISLFVTPFIFWICSIYAFITFNFLITRNFINIKNVILGGIVISSICGLIMLLQTAFTLGLSFSVQNANGSDWIDSFGHPFLQMPILGGFIGLSLGLTLFGILLAWYSPLPKQTYEINQLKEFIEKHPIPCRELSFIFFLIIWIMNFLFPLFLIFNHYFIGPNPITQFFFNNSEIFLLIGGISVLFPGPFLYALAILILFWKPLYFKLTLFLLNKRAEKISTGRKKVEKQTNWVVFGTLTIVEIMFIMIFTFLRVTIWIEVAILSFWSAFFIYSIFLIVQYT